jgi:A/G-specific adenine glycosylase
VDPVTPSPSAVRLFRKTVYDFFALHGRTLPWRRDCNPYRIFVAEVMLQQTQVDRVVAKYEAFIRTLPDFPSLAGASLQTVLSLWQGLGYNRRAVALKRAAEIVVNDFGGILPSSPDELRKLPGIGKATAASIAAFAFDMPTLFLETNIRTVLIHHFFADEESVTDRELLPLAERVLDRQSPRRWYSALMDYGSALKKRHGNAGRRSAHYRKQSRFEGSRRQKRGRVLKLLLAKGPLSISETAAKLAIDAETLLEIMEELRKEKLITRRDNRYLVASS